MRLAAVQTAKLSAAKFQHISAKPDHSTISPMRLGHDTRANNSSARQRIVRGATAQTDERVIGRDVHRRAGNERGEGRR